MFCIVVRSKSNIAIETALKTMTSPDIFPHTKHIWHDCFSIVKCVSDVTGGGGGSVVLPHKIFGFKGEKSYNFKQNKHVNVLS